MDNKTKKWIKIALREPLYVSRLIQNKLRKKFLFDYRFLKGYSFHPYTVVIVPTYRCNLRCKMCCQYEEFFRKDASPAVHGQGELGIEEWRKALDDIARWKPHVNVFGGEPLLYKHIIELVSCVKSKKLSCSIVTNGILLEKYAEALCQLDIEAVNISLDGPQEVHNEIRGVKSAFKKTVQGIRALQEFKRKRQTSRPRINMNCVVTEWNYDRLSEVVDIANDLQIDGLNFQHLMFTSEEHNHANRRFFEKTFGYDPKYLNDFPVLSTAAIDPAKLLSVVERLKRNASIPVRFLPNLKTQAIPPYYKQLEYQFDNQMCVAPWVRPTIAPNGDVVPCMGYVIGNVKDQKFTKIWNGQRFREFRQELRKRGLFPGCLRCCHRRYSK